VIAVVDAKDLAALVEKAVTAAIDKRQRAEVESLRPLSLHQASRAIRRRPMAILAAITTGELKATKLGYVWRIMPSDLRAWAGVAP